MAVRVDPPLANIEPPGDTAGAVAVAPSVVSACFTEAVLFMGREVPGPNHPPDEEAVPGLPVGGSGHAGLPVTIRTVDIGSDKPLDRHRPHGQGAVTQHLNLALGLRAIR
jgi:phosphotransferase system enzyme I (PtsI)